MSSKLTFWKIEPKLKDWLIVSLIKTLMAENLDQMRFSNEIATVAKVNKVSKTFTVLTMCFAALSYICMLVFCLVNKTMESYGYEFETGLKFGFGSAFNFVMS